MFVENVIVNKKKCKKQSLLDVQCFFTYLLITTAAGDYEQYHT